MSGDLRRLRAAAVTDTDADLAVRMFERSVCKQVAAMAAALGGLDMLVPTGGIGENDAATACAVRESLAWLPSLRIVTIASQEDEEIALHAARRNYPRIISLRRCRRGKTAAAMPLWCAEASRVLPGST
ncbi:hypothetical protein HMP09_3212 [Sphingomonas sp. HMP9]|nr:hypothetical protein HMP09_3212 [Sphingomonas sp. HMP9]